MVPKIVPMAKNMAHLVRQPNAHLDGGRWAWMGTRRAGGKCLPRRKFCNDVFNARYARNLGTMFKNQIIQNVMIAIWLVSWRWRWREI